MLFFLTSCSKQIQCADNKKYQFNEVITKQVTHRTNKIYTNVVQEGLKQARVLNFPTANIYVNDRSLKGGVYSCIISIHNKKYKGMCYHDYKRPNTLEAHLFNYDDNLYEKKITIELKQFIRAPISIKSLNLLQELIAQDAVLCKNSLLSYKFPG